MSEHNIKKELYSILSGKVVIVGIGNQLKSDDGFGPLLIDKIQGRVRAVCIDVGLSPENYIGKIIKSKPDVILFIDAVSMDKPAATIRLFNEREIPVYGFSTHNMSVKLMIEHIKSQISVSIFMLGIQPKSLEFAAGISPELKEALINLESIFIEILSNVKNA